MGKEIEKLAEKIFEAGVYKISYKAEKLSSGIYIYSLESEDFKEAKKFVLIK
jgi:hypothetical protein